MKRVLLCVVASMALVAVSTAAAFGAADHQAGETARLGPTALGAGGPDAYGYTWIDSDTAGGPTWNWVDIVAVGDSVEGLGDDNIVGPFSMGFDFPYYWYQVNQFYVGSNGYLRFSATGQWAQPFPGIPDPAPPNDVLAALVADLLFGGASSGHAWYYTNNVDSLVVSFIDVPGWNTGGSHTFQVILNRADSTITYQYGPQVGDYSNNETLIGIENATGTVGLQYLQDITPPENMPHDSLALLFTPPDTTTYQVHDAGIVYLQNQYNGGFFVHPGSAKTLWCKVKNYGNQPEASFDVRCEVRDPSNVVVYRDTVTVPPLSPGQIDSVVFSPDWVASVSGQHQVTATTYLGGDMNPNNNAVVVECQAMLYPGWLLYDDNSPEYQWSWEWTPGQEAGLGNRYTPPSYPCRIDSVSFHIVGAGAVSFICRVYDDDGPDGYPGTVLAADTVSVPQIGWNTCDLTSFNLVITDGDFYGAWIQTGDNSPTLGIDETPAISRQTLEYTGVWAEFRDRNTRDAMIRIGVDYGFGVEETPDTRRHPSTSLGTGKPEARLMQNYPNPFTHTTAIKLQVKSEKSKVSLRVYDLGGRLVRTLLDGPLTTDHSALTTAVSWDGIDESGRQVPAGVYFYKLTSGDFSSTKKLTVLR